MKISCQSCAAKYTIADEKVVGKVIKIKCKKCSSTIVVNGNDPGVIAQLQAEAAGGFDDQAATQLLSQPPSMDVGGGNPDEWTVSVTDDDQRTMTTAQILTEYAKGALNSDTYVWRDGMGDWLPLLQVPELAQLLAATTPSEPAPPAAQPSHNGGYGAPLAAAAAAPSAARRQQSRASNVDLFGGGGGLEEVAAAPPQGPPPGFDKHVGERNETSVLFSLKDLAAAEAQVATKPEKKNAFAARNDRVDDILSLGGGSATAPMLAPPPLNAPFYEPPPPPPSVAPISASPMAAAMSYAQPPQKKSPVPMIIGGLGALALVGGILFFVMAGGDKSDAKADSKTATADSKPADKTSDTTAKASDTSKAADTASAALVASATDTASASASGSTSASASASSEPVASLDPKTTATNTSSLAADPKKTDPKKEEPKKEEPKKEEPKDQGGSGDTPFDRGAASAALSSAAGGAKGCKKGDLTGSTKVQVTFAPSGKATQATVGPPFAGTPTGSCIAGLFRGLSVPKFSGPAMTVSKTVSIK